MSMKTRIGGFVGKFWRQAVVYSLMALFMGTVLWFRLGTLVPGLSYAETAARSIASTPHSIIDNPIFLPYKIAEYGLFHFHHAQVFWVRSLSAIWAVGVAIIFYDIIYSWYSRRIALMSGALLLTSAWFLHFARLATPEIMYTTSIGLLWVGMKLRSTTAPRVRTVLASVLILISCLYVPGLAWLIIPFVIWQRKLLWRELSKVPRWLSIATLVALAASLVPLVYAFVKTPSLIRQWLFIPSKIDLGLFWFHAWHLPVWLALKGPELPVYWLGHAPMLDIFCLVMGILGAFVLYHYRLLDRVRALVAIILLSLILAVPSGWPALTIALPLIFVVIAAGVALFLQQWFTVFPRNPLARAVGIGLVIFLITLSANYNVRHYFIAWPRSPDTKQQFNLL